MQRQQRQQPDAQQPHSRHSWSAGVHRQAVHRAQHQRVQRAHGGGGSESGSDGNIGGGAGRVGGGGSSDGGGGGARSSSVRGASRQHPSASPQDWQQQARSRWNASALDTTQRARVLGWQPGHHQQRRREPPRQQHEPTDVSHLISSDSDSDDGGGGSGGGGVAVPSPGMSRYRANSAPVAASTRYFLPQSEPTGSVSHLISSDSEDALDEQDDDTDREREPPGSPGGGTLERSLGTTQEFLVPRHQPATAVGGGADAEPRGAADGGTRGMGVASLPAAVAVAAAAEAEGATTPGATAGSKATSASPSTPGTVADAVAANNEDDHVEAGPDSDPPALPHGWFLYYDDQGYPYYFNDETGESLWELPANVVATAAAEGAAAATTTTSTSDVVSGGSGSVESPGVGHASDETATGGSVEAGDSEAGGGAGASAGDSEEEEDVSRLRREVQALRAQLVALGSPGATESGSARAEGSRETARGGANAAAAVTRQDNCGGAGSVGRRLDDPQVAQWVAGLPDVRETLTRCMTVLGLGDDIVACLASGDAKKAQRLARHLRERHLAAD